MTRLELKFEWEYVAGAAAPEIAATMARLEVLVGGEAVTRAYDRGARSVRTAILTPLHPIAEWLAVHWWSVLDECESPTRVEEEWKERHALSSAARGFPLPDLSLLSDGDSVRARWRPRQTRHSRIDFILPAGEAGLAVHETRQTLKDFVDAVAARLDEQGVVGTPLQEEWAALADLAPDEEPFCRTAGRLGLDPFDVPEADAAAILRGAAALAPNVWNACIQAVHPQHLAEAIDSLERGEAALRTGGASREVRSSVAPARADRTGESWQRGYRLAAALRKAYGLRSDQAFPLEEVVGPLEPRSEAGRPALPGIDGLAYMAKDSAPRLWTPVRRSRQESLRFLYARALSGVVECDGPVAELNLLTTARSAQQQVGRACAAELLAPADLLRDRFSSRRVDSEEVADLAEELVVSEEVVRRQIENHSLATIYD